MNFNDYLKQQIQVNFGFPTPNDFLQNYKPKDKIVSRCWIIFFVGCFLFSIGIAFGCALMLAPLWLLMSSQMRLMKHALKKHPRPNQDQVDVLHLSTFLSENLSQYGLSGFQAVERKFLGIKVQGSTFIRIHSGKYPYLLMIPFTHEVNKKAVNWFKIEYYHDTNTRMPDFKGMRGSKAKLNVTRTVPILVEAMNYYFAYECNTPIEN